MNRWLVVPCSCLALLPVVAAGCGGDDEDEDGGTPAATTEQPGTTEEPARTTTEGEGEAPTEVSVTMRDIEFVPKSVTVARGGTVTWTNRDSAAHDVTKTGGPGPEFKSGTGDLMRGDTFNHTFDVAGKIEYVCTVHPGMEGSVTVR